MGCGASTAVHQEPTLAGLAAASGLSADRLLHMRPDNLKALADAKGFDAAAQIMIVDEVDQTHRNIAVGEVNAVAQPHEEDRPSSQDSKSDPMASKKAAGEEEVRLPTVPGGSLQKLAEESGVNERQLLQHDAGELISLCAKHEVDVGAFMGEWSQRKEAAAWSQRMFRRIDRDNNGKLTRDELEYALEWLDTGGQLSVARLLEHMDVDGDGNVDETEWADTLDSCEGLAEALHAGEARDKQRHQ
jgi:hypothetical protein